MTGFAIVPFLSVPANKVPETFDSLESGQPSPSESKSNLFGIPSSSVSKSTPGAFPQLLEFNGTNKE